MKAYGWQGEYRIDQHWKKRSTFSSGPSELYNTAVHIEHTIRLPSVSPLPVLLACLVL